ncbi:hypothetical protein SUGI_0714620 [Cryptomeria japonica]|nr:hypothetical protein SUGI_0714620 [Cryptomeria japonica]
MQQSEGQGMSLPLKKVRSEEKVEVVQRKHPSSKPVILSLLKGSRFNGKSYYLPALSVSILPDCKHVVFSTAKVLKNGRKDLTFQKWNYQIGLSGEHQRLYSKIGANALQWNSRTYPPNNTALIWYRTEFNAPKGNNAVALDLNTMSKGQAWRNLFSNQLRHGCGKSSQEWYHVPRSWLHPTNNVLVLLEEIGGDPSGIGGEKSPELDAVSCSSLISGQIKGSSLLKQFP